MDFAGDATLNVEIMPITHWLTSTREAQEREEPSELVPRWQNRLCCVSNGCSRAR
jgi:hypothetical protein